MIRNRLVNYIFQKLAPPALPILSILTFLKFYIQNQNITTAVTVAIIIYGITLFFLCLGNLNRKSVVPIWIMLFAMSGILSMAGGENDALTATPYFIANAGFALAALFSNLKPKIYERLFYIYCAMFFYYMLQGSDPGEIFTVSRNFISVLVIMNISLYLIACQQDGRPPKIVVAVLGTLICLWGIGRAGIASLLAILLVSIFFSSQSYRKKLGVLIISILVAFILTNDLGIDLTSFLTGLERFGRLGVRGVREEINFAYLAHISGDLHSLLFGVLLDSIPEISAKGGNPHNSYIRLHANFGFAGVVLMTLLCITSIVRLLRFKKHLVLLVFVVSLFRSAFDVTAFNGPLDVIILYGIFYSMYDVKIVYANRTTILGQKNS